MPTGAMQPWRSEAFAEDFIGDATCATALGVPASAEAPALRWFALLTPLCVVLLSVAFAIVPPLA